MLTKLKAKNFRCYKNKSFEFDKHVTVIIGPNDRGKSTIVNLLRWITLNRPSGRTVIKRGAKVASGSLQIGGVTIKKVLSRSPSYHIDGKSYKAFGTKLPAVVHDIAQLTELNFQRQHESAFWLSLTPGQVAKELNGIVDLQSIDAVQASLAKQIRETSAQIRVVEERHRRARTERQALAWVRHFDARITRLEAIASRYRAKSHRIAQIASALNMAVQADSTRQRLLAGLPIAHRAILAGRKLRAASGRLAGLCAIYGAATSAQSHLIEPPAANQNGRKAIAMASQIAKLRGAIDTVSKHKQGLDQCKRKLAKKTRRFEKALNGRCPSCGGILTNTMKLY